MYICILFIVFILKLMSNKNKLDIEFQLVSGVPHVASTEIARIFNKRHSSVLRDIRVFIERNGELAGSHFMNVITMDKLNRPQNIFLIDKTGLQLFVAGYNTPELYPIKEALLEQLDEMYSKNSGVNTNVSEANEALEVFQDYDINNPPLASLVMERVETPEFWGSLDRVNHYVWSIITAKLVGGSFMLEYDASEIDFEVFGFKSVKYVSNSVCSKLKFFENIDISVFYELIDESVEEHFNFVARIKKKGYNPF